jgi:hypothetical protein
MRDCSWVPSVFENIHLGVFDCSSDRTPNYNCIAWAAGRTNRPWWPIGVAPYFWPTGPGVSIELPGEETIDNFVNAFKTEGYSVCRNGKFHRRYEKIALYVNDQRNPLHAARSLPSQVWWSKLGDFENIKHTNLDCLEGNLYGEVQVFLKRRIRCQRTNLLTKFRSFLSRLFVKQPSGFSPIPKENPTAS